MPLINRTSQPMQLLVGSTDLSDTLIETQCRVSLLGRSGWVSKDGALTLKANEHTANLNPRLNSIFQVGQSINLNRSGQPDPAFGVGVLRAYPGADTERIATGLKLDITDSLTFYGRKRTPGSEKMGIPDPVVGRPIRDVIDTLIREATGNVKGLTGPGPMAVINYPRDKYENTSYIDQAGDLAFGAPGGPWWLYQNAAGEVRMTSWPQIIAQTPLQIKQTDCILARHLNGAEYEQPQQKVKVVGNQITVRSRVNKPQISMLVRTIGDLYPGYAVQGIEGVNPNQRFIDSLKIVVTTVSGNTVVTKVWELGAAVTLVAKLKISGLAGGTIEPAVLPLKYKFGYKTTEVYRDDGLCISETYEMFQPRDQFFALAPLPNDPATLQQWIDQKPDFVVSQLPALDRAPVFIGGGIVSGAWYLNILRSTQYFYDDRLYLIRKSVYEQRRTMLVLAEKPEIVNRGGAFTYGADDMIPYLREDDNWSEDLTTGGWVHANAVTEAQALSGTKTLTTPVISYDANGNKATTGGQQQASGSKTKICLDEAPPAAKTYPLPYSITEKKLEAVATIQPRTAIAFPPAEPDTEVVAYCHDLETLGNIARWLANQKWGMAEGWELTLAPTPALLAALRDSPAIVIDLETVKEGTIRLLAQAPIFYNTTTKSYIQLVGQSLGRVVTAPSPGGGTVTVLDPPYQPERVVNGGIRLGYERIETRAFETREGATYKLAISGTYKPKGFFESKLAISGTYTRGPNVLLQVAGANPPTASVGSTLEILGNFQAPATVKIGNVPQPGFAVVNGKLVGTIAAGTVTGKISVTTPLGAAVGQTDFVINQAGTTYTDENAVDAVGAALLAGVHSGIAGTYGATQDGANRIDLALTDTGVTAGSYTNANITFDSQGRATAASNGSVPSLAVQTATGTAISLAPGTVDSTLNITAAKIFALNKVSTDFPARVRIYNLSAARTADVSRLATQSIVSPTNNEHGMLAECITTAANLVLDAPELPMFANAESPRTATVYLSVTNLDTVNRAITVTLEYTRFVA